MEKQSAPLNEGEQKAIEIMEEVEFGGRKPQNWTRWLIFGLALAWSSFQVYATWVGVLDPLTFRAIHLAFAFALVFLVFPFNKNSSRKRIPWADALLAILGTATALYVVFEAQAIQEVRGGFGNDTDLWLGSAAIVLLLLAAWRALGPAMPLIALVFLLFAATGPGGVFKVTLPGALGQLHAGATWKSIVNQLFLNTGDSIWGTPIAVSAVTVFVFVLFGALLDRAGAGQFFTDLSFSLLGGFRGGAAKASIIASALNGIVSGSSVSNVVTGGNFTIAAMKRAGYPPEKAAAIEVASSSNGQLMPPVMGAAAFLMADFLAIPYSELILMAIIPALLAYGTLLVVADLESVKLNLRGLPRSELPRFWPTLVGGLHYLLPLGYLLWALIIANISPERAALNTLFLLGPVILIQEWVVGVRRGRGALAGLLSGGQMLIDGMVTGARNMVGIAIATAVAGIIVGMVLITNLGTGLTELLSAISGGNLIIALILAQLISLLLGMGLPTTANYVVMASLVVPVILRIAERANFEVLPVQAHMFAFYFGIMADSTPPVALAAYAAAAIARANPFQTGVQGFIYELRTSLLAYMVFFNSALLGVSSIVDGKITWLAPGDLVWTVITAFTGLVLFSGATMGYLLGPVGWVGRIILIAASLLLIPANLTYDLLGLAVAVLVMGLQFLQLRRRR